MKVSGEVAAGAGVVDKGRLAVTPVGAGAPAPAPPPSFAAYERHLQFLPTAAALVAADADIQVGEKEELGAGRYRWAMPPPGMDVLRTAGEYEKGTKKKNATQAWADCQGVVERID